MSYAKILVALGLFWAVTCVQARSMPQPDPYEIVSVAGPALLTPANAVAAVLAVVRSGKPLSTGVCKCMATARKHYFARTHTDQQIIDVKFVGPGSPETFYETPWLGKQSGEFVIQAELDGPYNPMRIMIYLRGTPNGEPDDDLFMYPVIPNNALKSSMEKH